MHRGIPLDRDREARVINLGSTSVITGITFIGAVFGTLGSLYLTDGLLHRKYSFLRAASVVLSFSVLYGVPYGLVSGVPVLGLAVGVGVGLWFALRVSHRAPAGYYLVGAILGAAGFGIVCGMLYGLDAGLVATLSVGVGGVIPKLAAPPTTTATIITAAVRTPWRQRLAATPYGVLSGIMVVAGTHLGASALLVAGLGLLQGFVSTFGPHLIHWTDTLSESEIGAAGVVFILFGFLAQAASPLAQMFGLPVH